MNSRPLAVRKSLSAAPWLAAVVAVVALTPALVAQWGFIVDDAWIIARYAHHLHEGIGYRFNAGSPVTDGVTPLGYAHLLAPIAGSIEQALFGSRCLGLIGVLIGMGALAAASARARALPLFHRQASGWWLALLWPATSAPLAAWAGGGLATGLVTGLVAAGLAARELGRASAFAIALGVAAALRPELLPMALFLAIAPVPVCRATAEPSEPQALTATAIARIFRVAVVAAPFLVVAATRAVVFGDPAPLSASAKAPDVALGVRYALACFLLTGPVGLIAPVALWRGSAQARWLLGGVLVHFTAVALAGGDWMALSRVAVAALPLVFLTAVALTQSAAWWSCLARTALVVGAQGFVWTAQPDAAGVLARRHALIAELRPALASQTCIATLDIGWVGAAAPHAEIVDLAGVTDPEVAALPGGHTTRRIPALFLDQRHVDTLVLLTVPGDPASSWTDLRFARGVEAWISTFPHVGEEFEWTETSGVVGLPYVVLRRVDTRTSANDRGGAHARAFDPKLP